MAQFRRPCGRLASCARYTTKQLRRRWRRSRKELVVGLYHIFENLNKISSNTFKHQCGIRAKAELLHSGCSFSVLIGGLIEVGSVCFAQTAVAKRGLLCSNRFVGLSHCHSRLATKHTLR